LRRRHIEEALDLLLEDLAPLCKAAGFIEPDTKQALNTLLKNESPTVLVQRIRSKILEGSAAEDDLRKLIHLVLISIHENIRVNNVTPEKNSRRTNHVASVC